MSSRIRAGIGYDVHPLISGRRLLLGGVEIPFHKGLAGWSDADVLVHAVIDALLGAAVLGDIGSHFPEGETQYRGLSSLVLLERVRDLLAENSWRVVNVDATIVAEQPRLGGSIDQMRQHLSRVLGIDLSLVSVKASTSNQLGFVGRGEGMAAVAVALIESTSD